MPTLTELRSLGDLPSPGPVALRLVELASRDDVSAAELARALQADPALAGRVLKLANSAASGGRRVVAVTDAVVRLGFRGVRQLAVGFSLVERCRAGACAGFDYDAYWARSLASAVACERLARDLSSLPPDDAFTLGLLHDVGSLALACLHPGSYGALHAQLRGMAEERARATEIASYGICRRELTALLLLDWGLPESFVRAMQFRDAPAELGTRGNDVAPLLELGIDLGTWLAGAGTTVGDLPLELEARLASGRLQPGAIIADASAAWGEWLRDFGVRRPAPREPSVAGTAAPVQLHALVAEDSDSQRLTLERLLGGLGFAVTAVADGTAALVQLGKQRFDLLISDLEMPQLDGIGLVRALRAAEHGSGTYVIVLTAHTEQDQLLAAFEAGADDFLPKPIRARELQARVRAARRIVELQRALAEEARALRQVNLQLESANAELARTSSTDLLTGLPNRRHLLDCLRKTCAAAARDETPLAVLFVDIDHFKSINDRFGHDAGDIVLERVARVLKRAVRTMDTVGRFGGEEFVAVLPTATEQDAVGVAERILRDVAAEHFAFDGQAFRVTVSAGVGSTCRASPALHESLLQLADAALYAAKHGGRNRVVCRTQVVPASDAVPRSAAS